MTIYRGKVLVVDDDPVILDLLKASLEAAGFGTTCVSSVKDMEQAVAQRSYDAVLLDMYLDEEDGLSALPFLTREAPYSKVIMMSAHGTIELAVSAMEKGASSFIAKGKDPEAIVDQLKGRLEKPARVEGDVAENLGVIGKSEPMREVLSKVHRIREVDSTVLILGESGTGKEVIARAIHKSSKRGDNRFEAINCAAIPPTLLESELFGHKRGAFTDAKADRKGIFELCSEGTLLLDEIGEMPIELQAKLLRVLQEREVTPLGASKGVKINTRVIAATNKDLQKEVREGRFREDLYFRLAVLTIELAPLRERTEDIPALVAHFLQQMNERFGKSIRMPDQEVMTRLMAYPWYGNIRELQNAIERGVVLAADDEIMLEDMLPASRGSGIAEEKTNAQADFLNTTLSEAKQKFEREYLRQLLELTRGNISEIARISGRYRADVYRLLTKHGVEWEEFRPS